MDSYMNMYKLQVKASHSPHAHEGDLHSEVSGRQ